MDLTRCPQCGKRLNAALSRDDQRTELRCAFCDGIDVLKRDVRFSAEVPLIGQLPEISLERSSSK
ncbi:hypothetical protein XH92_14965 [Bradyrhizobium sp. CCBAU 53421]|nr:hypothetical protein XH92_14965 [Bradyrhizobium sp. CCBAU 53421]